jgi:hypothetical protein
MRHLRAAAALMCSRSSALAIAIILAIAGSTGAVDHASNVIRAPIKIDNTLISPVSVPAEPKVGHGSPSPLRIDNIRLEPGSQTKSDPSMILKFDMFNDSSNKVTDLVLEISIIEKPDAEQPATQPHVIAGPFTIRGKAILRAGFSITYQMLFHNLAPDCKCVANVDVLSLRSLPDSGPDR